MSQGCWGWFLRNVLCQDGENIPTNSRVIHVTSEHRFKELIGTSKQSVVVNFTAAQSSPCRYISPVYHEFSVKYPNTIFLTVDVDELKSVAKNHGVTTTPTFQFFRDGVKCDEMRGADRNGLEKRIQKHYVEDERLVSNGLRHRKTQVVTVSSEKQWEQLVQQNQESSKVLVVDFWATWCKPCTEIAPFFEELSTRFPAAVFARVDVDELESVTLREFDVNSLPCFKVFKEGKVVDELGGAIKSALEKMVAEHYDSAHAAAASC